MNKPKSTRIRMVYDGEIYEDFGTVKDTQEYYRKEVVDEYIKYIENKIENLYDTIIFIQQGID